MPVQTEPLNACAKSVTATKVRADGKPYASIFPCDCPGFVPLNAPMTSRICARCKHYRAAHYHRSDLNRSMPPALAERHVSAPDSMSDRPSLNTEAK